MKKTINQYDFINAFKACDRAEQFSRWALCALFTYVEQIEEDTGQELELDVIALCCEWCEYASAVEAAAEYGEAFDDEAQATKWLSDRTTVIVFKGGVIVSNF